MLKIGGINCTQGECIWLRFYRNHCIWFIWLIFFILFSMLTLFASHFHLLCESESRLVVPDSLRPHGLYSPWNSPGQNTGVGSLSLLQVIFRTQEWNPGLQHCRLIPYQLSHQGSPRILEWVAYPFSRGSSRPRNETAVSCMAGGFFTN